MDPTLLMDQADLTGDAHADHAAARGVSLALALGDVQRIRERSDHFCQPKLLLTPVAYSPTKHGQYRSADERN